MRGFLGAAGGTPGGTGGGKGLRREEGWLGGGGSEGPQRQPGGLVGVFWGAQARGEPWEELGAPCRARSPSSPPGPPDPVFWGGDVFFAGVRVEGGKCVLG